MARLIHMPVRPAFALAAAILLGGPAAAEAALPTPPSSAQPQGDTPGHTFDLKKVVGGLSAPLWAGHAPGDAAGLWVAEQGGNLYRVRSGNKVLRLSIAKRISTDGERGLLGVAFLPSYATSRLLVLSSTNPAGNTRVELWRMGATAKKAKLVRTLLKQTQPFPNHNGGNVVFGAGDTLYFGLGDGGDGDDPQRNAQKPSTRLGKILSAKVTATNRPTWRTVATGARNPWRFSYDPGTDQLWVGDVGQNAIEEVDRVPLGEPAPVNLGWSVFEGGQRDDKGDDTLQGSGKLIWPVVTYRHGDDGCSITGGFVYRGAKIPGLKGRYVFGDFCSGKLWSVAPDGEGVGPVRLEQPTVGQLTSFGVDASGELYAVSGAGDVFRLVGA